MSGYRQTSLDMDIGDGFGCRSAGPDEGWCPQAQNMPVCRLDLLANDHLDRVLVSHGGGLKGSVNGVVVTDGDHRKIGVLTDPLENLPRTCCPV